MKPRFKTSSCEHCSRNVPRAAIRCPWCLNEPVSRMVAAPRDRTEAPHRTAKAADKPRRLPPELERLAETTS